MGAPTLRTALEALICNHPYDPDRQTCRCVLKQYENDPGGYVAPITREQHATHVTNLVLGLLNGPAQILGLEVA